MGQMTFALMYGSRLPKPPKGKQWWGDSEEIAGKWVYQDGLFDIYRKGADVRVETDENNEVCGFFVAAGASGRDGVPHLDGPVSLATAASDKRYKAAHKLAEKAWKKWATWTEKQGAKFEPPRLWLVETEVA